MNFNLPAFLDIVIGLVFIYLILSLLASEIQEFFAGFFQWRAKHLKMSIYRMIGGTGNNKVIENILKIKSLEEINNSIESTVDSSKKDLLNYNKSVIKLVHEIYNHYEISSLAQSSLGFAVQETKNLYGPSYIPPEAFAIAFMDTLAKLDNNSSLNKEFITKIFENKNEDEKGNKIKDLPENLKLNIAQIGNSSLIRNNLDINSFKTQTEPEAISAVLSQFKQEIENWFINSQDRTSGTYKRNSKIGLFFIGLLAALLANANSFHIVENLHDESVREAVVTHAVATANECEAKKVEEKQAKEGENRTDLDICIETKVNAALKSNKLPIGWFESSDQSKNKWLKALKVIFYDFLGLVITSLAIMMGAPFWFDLLKKFVNVRNAGPKPPSK